MATVEIPGVTRSGGRATQEDSEDSARGVIMSSTPKCKQVVVEFGEAFGTPVQSWKCWPDDRGDWLLIPCPEHELEPLADHIRNWANDVLRAHGMENWEVKGVSGGPSLCLWGARQIWIEPVSSDREWRTKEIILHEIAHAIVGRQYLGAGDEALHGETFYKVYAGLIDDHILYVKK